MLTNTSRLITLAMLILCIAAPPVLAQPAAANYFGVDDASGVSGTCVLVPVNIVDVTDGPIQTIKFDILYDESILNLNSNNLDALQPGTLTDASWVFMLGSNSHSVILTTQQLHAIPDGSAGSVVLLNFSVIGAPGATGYMGVSEIEFANIENELGTAPAKNGWFIVNNDENHPPLLHPIGDKSIDEGSLLEFTITASDPDNDPLTYSADNLPTGATFDPATRTFAWTPDYGQAGSYPDVHFEVTDGDLTDTEDITITVNSATMDTMSLWHFDEGYGNIVYDSSGNNNDGTIHGASWTTDKLDSALRFDGVNDYVSIPDSLSLNPADEITIEAWVKTGAIPQTGWNKIIAKPYTSYTSPYQQYALTLHDDQFVFELNTEGIKEMLAGTETLESNTWYHVAGTYNGAEMRIYVNGEPNGTLSKSGAIARYPTDVHIGAGIYSNAQTEYLDGTIDEVRILNIALSADEIRADYETGLGDTTLPVADAGPDQTVDKDAVVYFDGSGSTDNVGMRSYSWDFDASDGIQPDATGVTASHIYTEPGSYIVTLTVTDTSGNRDTDTCMVTVNAPINRAPILNPIGDKSIDEGSLLEFTISASDPDGNHLTYSADDLPAGATFDPATRTFAWTSGYGQAGSYPDVHFEVTDGYLTDTEDITITVNSATMDTMSLWHFDEGYGNIVYDSSGNNNDGTIHDASWTTGKLDSALRFDGTNDYVSIPDSTSLNPADEITIEAWVKTGAIPQAGYRKIIAKPYTSYTSPWQQYALTLHDDQFVFELNAGGSKDGLIGAETLESNTWYHVAGTYNGAEMRIYLNGEPNGTLSKSGAIARYPTDVHIGAGIYSNAQTEYLDGTIDEVRILNIALSADEIRADYETGLGDTTLPVADAGLDQTVDKDAVVYFDGSGSTDNIGIRSYSWDFDASDGIQPGATGVTASHIYTEPGSYIVTLTVTDTSGNRDTDTCMVTVNAPINRAPILNPIGDKSINEGSLLEFAISASDPDGDHLTYSADNLPGGATFDPATRTFSWTPDYGQSGSYPDVHFEVTDGYRTDTEDITITVISSATTEYIWLEAEDADKIKPLMEIASDQSASGGSYIWVPDRGGWTGPGYARYIITITTPGDYKICGRVQAPTNADNSFLVRMDDDPDRTWTIALTDSWAWDEVNHWGSGTETDPEIDPVIYTLSAGEHILTIKHREDGTKLDRLLITNDLVYVPQADITSHDADASDGSESTDTAGNFWNAFLTKMGWLAGLR